MNDHSSVSRRRWGMIAFAFTATLINYLDRQALSVAAPLLREEFHLSNVEYSRILFGFLLGYMVMNGISGPLIDRMGTKLGYALCVAWWSVAALCHSFASGFWSLCLFRLLLGMGEAGNWPAAVKIVAEWFPKTERALAAGIFNSGAAVGAIIAPPLVAFIILAFGWKAAFAVVGLVGFLWLAFWWWRYESPQSNDASVQAAPLPVKELLRSRFVIMFTISKMFMDPVWYFYTFWFPEYLKVARGFDLAKIGKYAWIPFAVAGLGNFFGGYLSGFLLKRGFSVTVARKGAVTFFAVLMAAGIPAAIVSDPFVSIALASLAMLGYTGCLANMMAMPADVFPQASVASAYGLAGLGAGAGGMLFTLLTGWAVDHYSYLPVFWGFGLMPLVCAGILWFGVGPLRQREPAVA